MQSPERKDDITNDSQQARKDSIENSDTTIPQQSIESDATLKKEDTVDDKEQEGWVRLESGLGINE